MKFFRQCRWGPERRVQRDQTWEQGPPLALRFQPLLPHEVRTGTLYQIWYGRPQETLLFKKSRKGYFKHMEYIRIYILDIKNEEENIGNLKQLNLTLIFDKSLLQIVPRKHFCIFFLDLLIMVDSYLDIFASPSKPTRKLVDIIR